MAVQVSALVARVYISENRDYFSKDPKSNIMDSHKWEQKTNHCYSSCTCHAKKRSWPQQKIKSSYKIFDIPLLFFCIFL